MFFLRRSLITNQRVSIHIYHIYLYMLCIQKVTEILMNLERILLICLHRCLSPSE